MMALSGKALIGGLAVFWFLFGGADNAPADQKDARLPALFDQLKAAPDIAAATAIEARIWNIWLEANDPAIDTLMSEGNAALDAQKFGTALAKYNAIIGAAPGLRRGLEQAGDGLLHDG